MPFTVSGSSQLVHGTLNIIIVENEIIGVHQTGDGVNIMMPIHSTSAAPGPINIGIARVDILINENIVS